MALATFDDVLAALDGVLDWAYEERSRVGYFAALYRKVTAQVKEAEFEDRDALQRLDVAFAQRYLDAVAAHREGRNPGFAWRAAFDAAANPKRIILQQLGMSINAHINLDLAVAAARTFPGAAVLGIQRDFDTMNDVLSRLIDAVQDDISCVSPGFTWLDQLGGRRDERILEWSLRKARAMAWFEATRLARMEPERQQLAIDALDIGAARMGRFVTRASLRLRIGLWSIRRVEETDVRKVLEALR